MSGDAARAAAVACAWATATWLALGMRPDDRRACFELLARTARSAFRCARGFVRRASRPTGAHGGSEAVGLGDVSEMVEVVRLGLSAGLSFDAALELYCVQRPGALSRRLNRARLSWQMGIGTREGELAAAARDTGMRPLESFAAAVAQALSLGAPLGETLAGQSREMRAAHRADAEREIERIPVKLLVPTGTLILPALLLSIVGPLLAASGML